MKREVREYIADTIGASSPLIGIAIAITNVRFPEIAPQVTFGGLVFLIVLGSLLGIFQLGSRRRKDVEPPSRN